jgi:hypothetical protein
LLIKLAFYYWYNTQDPAANATVIRTKTLYLPLSVLTKATPYIGSSALYINKSLILLHTSLQLSILGSLLQKINNMLVIIIKIILSLPCRTNTSHFTYTFFKLLTVSKNNCDIKTLTIKIFFIKDGFLNFMLRYFVNS